MKKKDEPIYDRCAGAYDRMLEPLERRFLSRWRAEAGMLLPSDARLLEIGAGTGLNFSYYPAFRQAAGLEISGKMIEIASERAASIRLVQADAQNLPFANDSFDAVLATLVFCSIPEPETAFRELQRVIRNEGRIVLLEHVRPAGLTGYVFDALSILTVAVFEDHFNRETAKLVKDSGLKILEIRQKAFGAVNLIVCEVVK